MCSAFFKDQPFFGSTSVLANTAISFHETQSMEWQSKLLSKGGGGGIDSRSNWVCCFFAVTHMRDAKIRSGHLANLCHMYACCGRQPGLTHDFISPLSYVFSPTPFHPNRFSVETKTVCMS